MKDILGKMFENKNLSREEARDVLLNISDGLYNESQLSSFMTVFLMRSITTEELSGFCDAIMSRKEDVNLNVDGAIDIVGTGGDGKNTFNISTASCFVVAGAGYRVVKHGNYGSTSVSGASNLLEYFGVRFSKESSVLQRSLDESNMAYLHAPLFSSALKNVSGVRKALGVRTFFNMIGPLVNPTVPKNQMLGVFNLKLARLYKYIYESRNTNYMIVHSLDGYDEISLTDKFKIFSRGYEKIMSHLDLKLSKGKEKDIGCGGTIESSAKIFMNVLGDESNESQKSCVIANAGFAIKCLDFKIGLEEAISIARDSIESGRAKASFKKFLTLNKI